MMNEDIFKKAPLPIRKIPKDWNYNVLDDLIDFQNGYAFNSKNYTDFGKVIIRMSNISTQGRLQVNDQNVRYCSDEEYEELNNYHLEKDDLVICMTDVTPEKAIVGRTAVIDKNDYYILNQRVGRIRTSDVLNNNFLHYFTNSERYLNYIRNRTPGSAQFNLSTQEIKKTNVPLPPIKEQQKIAAILSSVDEAIEKTEQIIEQTEKVKKGLMQELLTKGIGHTEFKETPIGEIPKYWDFLSLNEVTSQTDGMRRGPFGGSLKKDIFVDSGHAVYEQQHVINNNVNNFRYYITDEKYNEMKSFSIDSGDILISCSGTVGKVLLIPENHKKGVINQALLRLRFNNEIMINDYAYYLLDSEFMYNRITGMTHGSTLKNIVKMQELRNIKVPVPNLVEQAKIVSIFNNVDQKIIKEKYRLKKVKKIKQGLMQELLTGKKRVKIDDSEEVFS